MQYSHDITEDVPPAPGLWLYSLSKAVGHEVTRVYAANFPQLHVVRLLVSGFFAADPPANPKDRPHDAPPTGIRPLSVTFADAGEAVRCALEVPLQDLPSRCETFFVGVPNPASVFRYGKAERLLGWRPANSLESYLTPRRAAL